MLATRAVVEGSEKFKSQQ